MVSNQANGKSNRQLQPTQKGEKKMRPLLLLLFFSMMIVLGGTVYSSIALQQDFEGFSDGPLTTTGQGLEETVGGWWRADSDIGDPSIATAPPDPDSQVGSSKAIRLYGNDQKVIASSSFSPIPSGTPFIISYKAYFNYYSLTEEIGSFYFYADNINELSSNSNGIALYNETMGGILVYSGETQSYKRVNTTIYEAQNQWVQFKIYVSTWNDGTGYGRYDLWIKKQGQSWQQVEIGNKFRTQDLHDGVNAVMFESRAQFDDVINYIDDVYIASEPQSCIDAVIMGMNHISDMTGDCIVNMDDFALFSQQWKKNYDMDSGEVGPIEWFFQWEAEELPEAFMSGTKLTFNESPVGASTRSIANGIYSCISGGISYVNTKPGVYNPSVPLIAEGRIKYDASSVAGVLIRDYQHGYVALTIAANTPYIQPDGWITYRVITTVVSGHLAGASIYYQDVPSGRWVLGQVAAVTLNTDTQYSTIAIGDLGSSWYGTHHIDYLYFAQGDRYVDSFLATTWLFHWNANELPETFSGGSYLVFNEWTLGSTTRSVTNGVYTSTSMTASNTAYISTKPNVINPALPVMAEGRIKIEDSSTAAVVVRELQYGYVTFTLFATTAYRDANGWLTFRVVSRTADGHLAGADLFLQSPSTGLWILSQSAPVISQTTTQFSLVGVGDYGGSWLGTHHIDYFAVTQNQSTIHAFLAGTFWRYVWEANELPGQFLSSSVFQYAEYPPNSSSQSVSDGVYTCIPGSTTSNIARIDTKSGIVDATKPFMVEARVKIDEGPSGTSIGVFVREYQYGYVLFNIPYIWNNPFADSEGWIRFRIMTHTASNHLAGGSLYYRDPVSGRWVQTVSLPVTLSSTQGYSCMQFGDLGGYNSGTYHIDYLAMTQDANSIESFRSSMVWQFQWDANELPEDFLGGNFLAFAEWEVGTSTRSVEGGVCSVTSANQAYTITKNGVVNPAMPLMVQGRIKFDPGSNAAVYIRQASVGHLYLTIERNNPYADAQGWTIFRATTRTVEGNLVGADLYYLNLDMNTWVHVQSANLMPSNAQYSALGVGDIGYLWQGTHHIDYLYFTQNQQVIDNFLYGQSVRAADFVLDGKIDINDFFAMVEEWLQAIP